MTFDFCNNSCFFFFLNQFKHSSISQLTLPARVDAELGVKLLELLRFPDGLHVDGVLMNQIQAAGSCHRR